VSNVEISELKKAIRTIVDWLQRDGQSKHLSNFGLFDSA